MFGRSPSRLDCLTLRLQLDAAIPNTAARAPFLERSAQDSGLKITTAARPGLVADLFDETGHILVSGQSISIWDSRPPELFLRVSPSGAQAYSERNFFVPDFCSETRSVPPPFRSRLSSTVFDAHDILSQVTIISIVCSGDGRTDALMAKAVEVRDLAATESRTDSLDAERIIGSQSSLKPLIPRTTTFTICAQFLAIARALQLPVTISYGGAPLFRGEISAVRWRRLTRLALNGLISRTFRTRVSLTVRSLSLAGKKW